MLDVSEGISTDALRPPMNASSRIASSSTHSAIFASSSTDIKPRGAIARRRRSYRAWTPHFERCGPGMYSVSRRDSAAGRTAGSFPAPFKSQSLEAPRLPFVFEVTDALEKALKGKPFFVSSSLQRLVVVSPSMIWTGWHLFSTDDFIFRRPAIHGACLSALNAVITLPFYRGLRLYGHTPYYGHMGPGNISGHKNVP